MAIRKKSEYGWMNFENIHAHYIKSIGQKYNFEMQTNTWQGRNYNLR
jgi:hypothetical protein